MANDIVLETRGLVKKFGDAVILNGIDFTLHDKEVAVILGPSGCGKSTFLRCLNLLEEPTGGQIVFEGVDITSKETKIDQMRQKIGMVFQGFNLFNNKSVLDNCTLAPMDVKHIPKAQAEAMKHRFEKDDRENPWSRGTTRFYIKCIG